MKDKELTDETNYINSEPFLNRVKAIELMKQQKREEEEQLTFKETQNKILRKQKELEGQLIIKKDYDPRNVDAAGMIEQVRALGDNITKDFEARKHNIEIDQERMSLINSINENIEKIKNRYNTQYEKDTAESNIFGLVEAKTGNLIGKDYNEYNLSNLRAMKGFTGMLFESDKDALTVEKAFFDFMKTKPYIDFPWDVSQTNQGE